MAEPTPTGAHRRPGLRRARAVALGSSVGAAIVLTGTIAVVNAAPSDDAGTDPVERSTRDDGGIADEELEDARPFTPRSTPSPTAAETTPQATDPLPSAPQTRSAGS